jgi:hypothetical protein
VSGCIEKHLIAPPEPLEEGAGMFMAAGSSKPGGSHVQDPGNGAVPIDGVKPLFLLQVNRQDQVRKRVAPVEKHGGRAGGQIFFDPGCVRQANGNVVLPAPVIEPDGLRSADRFVLSSYLLDIR